MSIPVFKSTRNLALVSGIVMVATVALWLIAALREAKRMAWTVTAHTQITKFSRATIFFKDEFQQYPKSLTELTNVHDLNKAFYLSETPPDVQIAYKLSGSNVFQIEAVRRGGFFVGDISILKTYSNGVEVVEQALK